ncbi:MAG: putative metallophosphoesterase [Bacteroidetes bacterium ADurb.Bin123]|jgi:hypothetical protein|nr:MAG: putative metallophosphoesterase [Bacteroidetes bacterium ADurb.Bin123]
MIMRSVSGDIILILLLAYWMFTLSAWPTLRNLISRHRSSGGRILSRFYFILAIIQSGMLLLLYGWQVLPLHGTSFVLYFLFNGVLTTDMFIKLPLMMASLFRFFLSGAYPRRVVSCMGAILATGFFLLFLWGFTGGIYLIKKKEITLNFDTLPPAFDGFRIVHLSDLHLGSYRVRHLPKRMLRVSHAFSPDVIVFTGDLVNNHAWETEGTDSLFVPFTAGSGRYAVLGNHDYGDYFRWQTQEAKAANFRSIAEAFSRAGLKLLCNESVCITRETDSLYLVGVENWGNPPFPRYADLQKAGTGIPGDAFRILLSHDPAPWQEVIDSEAPYPLTLSGHTHGMQWGIRFAGLCFSSAALFAKFWGGLYGKSGKYLYVNPGTGIIGMPFRIDMPPEITLITLRRN